MADSDIVEDYGADGGRGGKVKGVVGVLGALAVLFVLLKLRRRGSSSEDEYVDLDEREEPDERASVDTVTTSKNGDEGGDESEGDEIEVEATGLTSGRFDDLDLVDYLAIFAAALQAARDEYRIRTNR